MFLTNGNEVIYLLIYVYPIIVFELLAEPHSTIGFKQIEPANKTNYVL